jgi:hypothetical protein
LKGVLTLVPLLLAGLLTRVALRLNFSTICNLPAGSMTHPALLGRLIKLFGANFQGGIQSENINIPTGASPACELCLSQIALRAAGSIVASIFFIEKSAANR